MVRAGHSGSDGTSPDLIALRSTKKFGLECKAVNAPNLYIERPKFIHYQEWQKRTGMPVFIAWRPNHKEWKFFPLEILRETEAAFALSQSDLAMGMTFDDLTR
ncbi:Holliday junction resolvase Hjc [uncultured archaeon]|nr:Holliday junction resolvase Hjc [uncultured archaeon]